MEKSEIIKKLRELQENWEHYHCGGGDDISTGIEIGFSYAADALADLIKEID